MSKPNRNLFIIGTLLLIAIGVALITSSKGEKQQDEIVIGAIMGLTGSNNHQALVQQKGLELAVKEINRMAKVKVRIIYEDHANDQKKAVAGYQNLKARYPQFPVVITMFSAPSLAVAPLAEKDATLQFVLGTVSPKISEAGEYIFRNSVLPADEIKTILSFINKKFPKEKHNVGILSHQNPGGKEWALAFKKTLSQQGGGVAFEEYLNDQNPEYDTTLLKLKHSKAEIVLLPLFFQQVAQVLKKVQELGVSNKTFITYFPSDTPELLELAEGAAEGLILTSAYATNHQRFQSFASAYQQTFREEPEFYSALAYDSMYILQTIFKRCEYKPETACLKSALAQVEYDGLTGKTTFDENGDTRKNVILKIVRRGKFVTLEE